MEVPLQITFRDMEPSPAVEERVRERAALLSRFAPSITQCHVVVEAPPHHHHQGGLFHVMVELTLPGAHLVVNRRPPARHAHEDVYVAIRDAFDAARRQVEDHRRRQRGEVKTHAGG
ncbi:MAG: HPF/RaiA family ribosome-associated protein [Deltaproteobacteria bacterium]|nr:HPF/RaiA family ribosome-associated protein [Deltaproteobacteria bacterium]